MPYSPSGNYSLVPTYFAQPGTVISTSQHNPVLEDIAQALSNVLVRDGRNGMVGNLTMSGFGITNLKDGVADSDAATKAQVDAAGPPVGSVIDFAGATAPSGWLFCAGQAVSRAAYAALFAVIDTTYGVGDGTTTFNLPDARGRVTAGKDNMGGTAANRLTTAGSGLAGNTLGQSGGNQSHALTLGQMPTHSHTVTGNTSASGNHTHNIRMLGGFSGVDIGWGAGFGSDGNGRSSADGQHSHSISGTTNNQGSGQAHPIVQPTLILNKIIRAS